VKHFAIILAAATSLYTSQSFALADHLLLSEVGINTGTEAGATSSEYAEVFNPTAATIPLDNYYMSDYNATANKYYSVVTFGGPVDLGSSDYLVRFPSGFSLAPGKVAVVCQDAVTFLDEFFGNNLATFTSQPGSPLLFEVIDSDPNVPNMINFNSNATNPGSFGKTNAAAANGEHMVLFNWDQTSDLVRDLDIIQWGNPTGGNAYVLKSPSVSIDGPDADTNPTAFATDNGPISRISITASVDIVTRVSSDETGETTTGGNGLTGNDETTEDYSVTWIGEVLANRTPGTTSLPSTGGNATPQITSIWRSIKDPSSASSITIEAGTADADGSVVTANLFVDSGTGFTAVPMSQVASSTTFTATIGPYADDTIVKFYVAATDNGGATITEPGTAPTDFRRFLVDNTPVTENDLIINEIMYNCAGSDTYEFVELYNKRNTPVDISAFGFGDNLNNIGYRFPEGTIVPAEGYLVLTIDFAGFETEFGAGTVNPLLDWGTFGLNNDGGDFIHWIHVNNIEYNGTNVRSDLVNYLDTDPWPTAPDGGGPSLELKSPELDNSPATSWKASSVATAPHGTPGAANSVDPTSATDWQLFQ
jgi:hypothetical protein